MVSPAIQAAADLLRHRRARAEALHLTLPQRRAAFEANAELLLAATDIDVEAGVFAGVAGERLNGAATGGTLLYLHGGGYCVGSPRTHRELAGRLARSANRVGVVPDYRLAPEHPFPAGLDDAFAVYRSLCETEGAPPTLAGDSAGGGLALALLLRLREDGLPLPPRVAVLSPWTDLTLGGASIRDRAGRDPYMSEAVLTAFADAYAPVGDRRRPLVSPLHADLSGFPLLWIEVGSEEVLFDDAARLHDRARADGVEATLFVGEGLFHVWQAVPGAPEALAASDRIGSFLSGSQT
ncbi:alpha/beta hydrolase [Brevundimonas variabilis]|uniref:Acetyl esterase/lipase n=1 Tax=Brevundimonas variabilis TaxID=74312 RepID=A0A7W9FGM1_9CAUL|nr:alpha/beta hydrolase [Brevundimonas variabilis]MBB5746594.1 acetyl esterase/lipase [Brevundimonas variabilis]